jgi:hypothetical protein
VSALAAEYEIVVESGPDGARNTCFKAVSGNWMESTGKSRAEGLQGTKALFKTINTTPGSARFTPDIPVAGKYEVLVTYPDSGNASGVVYAVHSVAGDKETVQNQNGRDLNTKHPANSWFSLGVYEFAKGTDGYVEIRDPGTGKRAFEEEPNGRVYADAVKLVPEGFELPAEFAKAAAKSPAPGQAGMPSMIPAKPGPESMPMLAAAVPTASSALPSLGAPGQAPAVAAVPPAIPPATGLPNLGTAPQGGVPPLPSLGATPTATSAVGSMPALPGASAPQVPGLPSLAAGQPSTAMPSQPPPLPALAGTPAPSSVAGLPSLGEAQAPVAAAPVPPVSGLPTLGEAIAPAPRLPGAVPVADAPPALPMLSAQPSTGAVPSLPGLEPAPAVSSASVPASALPGLPGVAPGAPSAGLPPMPGVPGTPAEVPGLPSMALPAGIPPAPPAMSAGPAGPGGIQWMYDEGAAHAAARSLNKRVLMFFVAQGNRQAQKYENEYFGSPAVRAALDKFVLFKVDFPQNTRAGYKVKIFGAGMIAVTDANGDKLGAVTQIPASAEELATQLEALAK